MISEITWSEIMELQPVFDSFRKDARNPLATKMLKLRQGYVVPLWAQPRIPVGSISEMSNIERFSLIEDVLAGQIPSPNVNLWCLLIELLFLIQTTEPQGSPIYRASIEIKQALVEGCAATQAGATNAS